MGGGTSSGRTAPAIIPRKDWEKSLSLAVGRIKRNLDSEKYSLQETLEDAAYEYRLREEEQVTARDQMADYLEKNGMLYSRQIGMDGSERREQSIERIRRGEFSLI